MVSSEVNAVTGAFGYSGKYIAQQLLGSGKQVISLTGHPERTDVLDDRVRAFPFNFNHPERLIRILKNVNTLYNTYWVRFDHANMTFDRAVENTRVLFNAAREAGVRRIVHVSISNPSLDSSLPYFRGKAVLENFVREMGLSYAIIRPTVIFSLDDVLINNIAYLVRKFPVFVIPGSGEYRIQPVYVRDMAKICVESGGSDENLILDAVGPEIFTFNQLVALIGKTVGRMPLLLHLHPRIAIWISRLIGRWKGDVILTRDEYTGLSAELLISDQPPTGETRFSHWLEQNADKIGLRYASELERHYKT
jgi:NADH dehydrogenase